MTLEQHRKLCNDILIIVRDVLSKTTEIGAVTDDGPENFCKELEIRLLREINVNDSYQKTLQEVREAFEKGRGCLNVTFDNWPPKTSWSNQDTEILYKQMNTNTDGK